MARATRSSNQQEKDKPLEPAPPPRKGASKKRKRTSLSDGTDHPASKQPRTDDDIKEEVSSQEPDDAPISISSSSALDLPSSGDVPIQSQYAEKILDILEVVDTQGLLDRVFPLPTEQEDAISSAGPSSSSRTYSFRSLLKEPELYTLRVLRSAVQHLFPISSHPRSRPSATATEQLRFCNLALSLLDQASFHSSPVPLGVESLIETVTTDGSEEATSPEGHATRQRKYALVQKLSSGDWWTSTNSTPPSASEDRKALTDLPTAHADLAVIFPTPSSANMKHGKTLAAYAAKNTVAPEAFEALQPRQLCAGKFLDYGPYASFAPTFDQGGMEVGRVALGEVIFQQERKRRLKAVQEKVRAKQIAARTAQTQEEVDDRDVQVVDSAPSSSGNNNKTNESLEGLLSSDEVAKIKLALGNLDLEASVDELLTRNARALQRLGDLQNERLGTESGAVQGGSEEWEIAQNILESLTVLAAFRPRSSGADSDHPPLVPTASALRKLHRTLPIGDTGGWYGTLPPGRPGALRDDTTVRMKAGTSSTGAVLVASTPAAPIATPAPSKTVAPTTIQQPAAAAATTTTYSYPTYPQHTQNQQYRGGYSTYQQQPAQYYPYPSQAQQPAVTHYPNAQYNINATGQQQYYPSGWFNYQPPAQQASAAAVAGGGSGRATPHSQPNPTSTPGSYTFYNNASQHQQRAVANTVLSAATSKPYQQGAWPNGGAAAAVSPHVPATLPPHLRGAQGAAGTPGMAYQAGYHQNVQQTTPLR